VRCTSINLLLRTDFRILLETRVVQTPGYNTENKKNIDRIVLNCVLDYINYLNKNKNRDEILTLILV